MERENGGDREGGLEGGLVERRDRGRIELGIEDGG